MKEDKILRSERFTDAKKNLEKMDKTISPFSKKGSYREVRATGKWKPVLESSVFQIHR